jgi:8-oxo-dGTP pyrophosphatase MutT (NUDIX family)
LVSGIFVLVVRFTWHVSNSCHNLSPIGQVYGVCFDNIGKILIQRSGTTGRWNIPGGHPEIGETPEETLEREFDEEVSVTIGKRKVIGYFEATNGEHTYQLRYFCLIDKVLPMKIDPASGKMNERKFVDPGKFFDFVKIDDYKPMISEALKCLRENSS